MGSLSHAEFGPDWQKGWVQEPHFQNVVIIVRGFCPTGMTVYTDQGNFALKSMLRVYVDMSHFTMIVCGRYVRLSCSDSAMLTIPGFLWSPYVIGRPYIFSCCGLFFFLLLFFFLA